MRASTTPFGWLALALCLTLPRPADAYTPLSPDGTPLRWPVPEGRDRPLIEFTAYPRNGSGIPDGVVSALGRQSLARWRSVTEHGFDIHWWTVPGQPPPVRRDGVSTLTFASALGDAAPIGLLPATALVRSDPDGAITEVDILVNDRDFTFTIDPLDANPLFSIIELEAVLTHEFGHLLGLDHSGVLDSTLLPWPFAGQVSLSCDDVAGIREHFGLATEHLTGRVLGPDGAPAAGVQVLALEHGRGRAVAALTEPDGEWRLAVPGPGSYSVSVEPFAPGAEMLAAPLSRPPCGGEFPRQWFGDGPHPWIVDVPPAGHAVLPDLTLNCQSAPGASGAGRIHGARELRTGVALLPDFVGEPEEQPSTPGQPRPAPPGDPGDPCDPNDFGSCTLEAYCDPAGAEGPVCRLHVCGDGLAGPYEACDDGNDEPDDGCIACEEALLPLGAPCTVDGPACDPMERCDGDQGRCRPHVCGDGIPGGDEACDVGAESDPHCTFDCRLRPFHDDRRAPDSLAAPMQLELDARGDARIAYALEPGERDFFAVTIRRPARLLAEIEEPRGARCTKAMLAVLRAGDTDPSFTGGRGYDTCAKLDARLAPGTWIIRTGEKQNGGHGQRWLSVRLRTLPEIGEACTDSLAPCPDDAFCGNGRVCVRHRCGDGRRGPGEACDDGNTDETDGCTVACERIVIPVGGPCSRNTDCDDGAYCEADRCTAHVCGDAVVGPGEDCDDANSDDADGCASDCRFTARDRFVRRVDVASGPGRRYFALTDIAGSLVIHALDWGLHGSRTVRLELLDVRGVPVPGVIVRRPRVEEADGFVDRDTTLVAHDLPPGDYLLAVGADLLPERSSPRAGRLRRAGETVVLLGMIGPDRWSLPFAGDPALSCAPALGAADLIEERADAPPLPARADGGCAVHVGWEPAPRGPLAGLALLLLIATRRRPRRP